MWVFSKLVDLGWPFKRDMKRVEKMISHGRAGSFTPGSIMEQRSEHPSFRVRRRVAFGGKPIELQIALAGPHGGSP